MKRLLTATLLTATLAGSAQTDVRPYLPGTSQEGITYCLTKTAVRAVVQVEKTAYTPGELAHYAGKYLNRSDVQTSPHTAFRIVSAKLSPFGMADTTKMFVVRLNPKTAATNVAKADDGRLLAINAEPEKEQELIPFVKGERQEQPDVRRYMTEEMTNAGTSAKRAELAAIEIFDIRDSKNQLNRGQADFMPKDGEQLRIMLDNLNRQELALTQLFEGTTSKDTTEYVFTFCPATDTTRTVLFRFSERWGMTDAEDYSGQPFFLNVENMKALPVPVVPADKKKKKTQHNPNALYVNMPGRMHVTLTDISGRRLAGQDFNAGQFGNVDMLSSELFNKKFTTHITFDPIAGGILHIEAEQPK